MTAIQIITRADMVGKKAQLPNRTTTFTFQSHFRQPCFRAAHFGDRSASGIDFVRDFFEESRPSVPAYSAVDLERLLRCHRGLFNQRRGSHAEFPSLALQ